MDGASLMDSGMAFQITWNELNRSSMLNNCVTNTGEQKKANLYNTMSKEAGR